MTVCTVSEDSIHHYARQSPITGHDTPLEKGHHACYKCIYCNEERCVITRLYVGNHPTKRFTDAELDAILL